MLVYQRVLYLQFRFLKWPLNFLQLQDVLEYPDATTDILIASVQFELHWSLEWDQFS